MEQSTVSVILQFAFATLLPVAASVIATLFEKYTRWGKSSYWTRQIVYGLAFGLIAVYGTEHGIVTHDATMNVRDAAPLVAGLYFGGPAGIIAGIIGGVERWFAALWGRGMFTRVACSTATALVGFYAAGLRKYLFDGRRPSWLLALAIGVVAEVLHLLLVFITNLGEPIHAFMVVQACTFPMVGCNAVSVAAAGGALALVDGKSLRVKADKTPDISQKIQVGMLGVVVVGFVTTVGFVYTLQSNLTETDTSEELMLALDDMEKDIRDASDANLLTLARKAAQEIGSVDAAMRMQVGELASSLDLAEIHVIDERGIIVASSDDLYVGYDMASGDQSAEFLELLDGARSEIVQAYQPMSIDGTVWRKFAGVRIEGGFLQAGYDAERFIDDLTDEVRVVVANRHVGNGGQLAVLSDRGELIGTRSDASLSYRDVQHLASAMGSADAGSMFVVSARDTDYIGMYRIAEGLRVVSLLPLAEAEIAQDLSVLVTSFIEVIVFAALFAAIYVLVKRVVVRSIWQVNGRLGQITKGDLGVEVDVRDSVEFASLSDDINRTVAALRDAIAAEGARIERDLATAKAIQESALPRTFPPFPDIDAFDIFASMNAAREVGGDFYDFFLVDDHTLGFLIADVSGKGIPASLFMMAAKSELANYIKSGMDLAEAVHSANWNLCQGNEAGMFVTVWAATLDYNTGLLTYVNAGHNPPLLRHNGTWEWLKKKGGLFLGTFDTAKYRSAALTLVPGDEILLYTDGVNEAFSASEEEYGNDRLEQFLATHANLHPRMLVDVLRVDIRRWSKGVEQSDDITMVCLEYGTPPEVSGEITVPSTSEGFDELMRRFHFDMSQIQCPEAVQTKLDLTIEELFTNVCEHGYADMEQPGHVRLTYIYDTNPAAVTISLTDWGQAFDPLSYDKERDDADGDEVSGAGIMLALSGVDDFAYVRDGNSNVMAFRKSW